MPHWTRIDGFLSLRSRWNGLRYGRERCTQSIPLTGITQGMVVLGFILILSSAAWALTDGIAAIVNAEIITLSELRAELKDETIRLKTRFKGEELKRRLLQREYETLNQLIERRLQLQEAKSKGLEVSDEEIQNALEKLGQGQSASPAFPLPSRESIREELILGKLRDFEVRRHIMVSQDEVRDYYEKNQSQFMSPPEYRLRQILFSPKPGEPMTEVHARAQSVFSELKKGGNFSNLATRYSDGPEAVQGGELGFLRKDELLAPLGKELDRMQPGEVSQPLETSLGIHIIALDDVKPAKATTFQEVEPHVRYLLYQKKTQEAYQAWLSNLEDKAYIEVKF